MIGPLIAVLRAHTVERVRAAWRVATFPLVTPRYYDPRLWRACGRLAWRGLWHRRPDALLSFLTIRDQVMKARSNAEHDAQRPGNVPGWHSSKGPGCRN